MLCIRFSPGKNEYSALEECWVLATFLGQALSWLTCVGLTGRSGYVPWQMLDLKCCYFGWRGEYFIQIAIERIALTGTLYSPVSRVTTSWWDFFVLKFSTSD